MAAPQPDPSRDGRRALAPDHGGHRHLVAAAGRRGGAVLELVGADAEATKFGGTRVDVPARRTLTSAACGRVTALREAVFDPQPPFGMGAAVVTPRTAEVMLESFARLAELTRQPAYRSAPSLDALPELSGSLPDLGTRFARCQADRR